MSAHEIELATPGEKPRADDVVAARPEQIGSGSLARLA
jgi:hypothetical protein